MVPLPYPPVRVKEPNLGYARLLSLPYAGTGGELTAILQYLYAHMVCENAKPSVIHEVFSYIAEVEMRHMEILGGLIVALGGLPKFQTAEGRGMFNASGIQYHPSPDKLLRAAILGEQNAIAVYQRVMANIDDDYIRDIIARIIKDEEHHIKIFSELTTEIN